MQNCCCVVLVRGRPGAGNLDLQTDRLGQEDFLYIIVPEKTVTGTRRDEELV